MEHRRRRQPRTISVAVLAMVLVSLVSPAAYGAAVEFIPIRQIGGPGHAGLYGWGMATAPDGSIYISDYWNFRIQHYTKDGTLLGTVVPKKGSGPGTHAAPYGIGVDPRNGDIYFGDVDSNATVDKWSASGQFLYEVGGLGTGLGKFTYPSRVAVMPDGTVIVSDSRAEKLVVLDDSGHFLFEKLGVQNGDTILKRPRGIAVDSVGNLYVADAGLQKIQVFTVDVVQKTLTYVRSMGTPKLNPGDPNPGEIGRDLRGLAIDEAHDALYVVDADTMHVAKFRMSDGTFLQYFASEGTEDGEFSGGGRDITVDGDGNVWVGDMPNFRAQKFDPNGNFLQKVPDPPQLPQPGGFAQPFSVAVDPAGNIFVSDTYNWRIQKFDPNGNFVLQWGSRGIGNYQFNYARGIAIDPFTSNVIVADSDGNAIKEYTNDGVFLCSMDKMGAGDSEFKGPMSVDVGPDGLIYVADTQNGRVEVLETTPTPGGCDMHIRATNGVLGGKGTTDGKFQATNGIAVDTDGTLWVADRLQGRVTHLSNTGAFLGKFGTGVGTGPTQFARARDVEVDADYVYVSDCDANRISVWRKDGTFVRTYGSTGGNLGQFQRPQGMDLTPDGRLLVAEQTNERVQVLKVAFNVNPEVVKPNGDVTVPAASQAFPSQPITFSGSATDDTGISTVQYAIRNTATGQYWTGTGWGAFTWLFTTPSANGLGATSITWTAVWSPPAPGTYGFQARAQDIWGNLDPTIPFRLFSVYQGPYDPTRPVATMTVPTKNQQLPVAPMTFAGTGADNFGVAGAQVAIKNTGSGLWWTGSTWGPFTWLNASVASPGALSTTWSFGWTPPGAGSYGVQARVRDFANNYSNIPFVTFKVQ